MHQTRLSICNFNCNANEKRTRGIKYVKNIIQDLERYGPAGLIHIIILSNIIEKPIRIWNCDGTLNRIIGKEKKGCPVNIEYHSTDSKIGHWTLKHGKNPDNITIDLNSCLFSVIGSQIRQDPSKLRKQLALKLKCNLQEFAYQTDEIIRLKGNKGVTLMIGGACYNGQSPEDAHQILNNSQGAKSCRIIKKYREEPKSCEELRDRIISNEKLGHPRGHVSYLYPDGTMDCVQNYARKTKEGKTAFLSESNQDLLAHLALTAQDTQDKLKLLNNGSDKEASHISRATLQQKLLGTSYCQYLPMGAQFDKFGNAEYEANISTVTLVMRHYKDYFCNEDKEVLVQSFFPVLEYDYCKAKPKRRTK